MVTSTKTSHELPPLRYRVAILTSHVIQYQDPMFRRLAEEPSIDLEVLFCSPMGREAYLDRNLGVTLSWDIDMLHGYDYRFLRNLSPVKHGFFSLINPGIISTIARQRYDAVVVMGWGSVSAWLALATCSILKLPYFISGDTSFVEDASTWRGRLRRRVLETLFSRTSGFLVVGAMNGDFYRAYGADPARFFHVPYAVDNTRFENSSRLSRSEVDDLRSRFGIDRDKTVILFAGKLQDLKNPAHLLSAFERMRHREDAALAFMGDGVERPALEKLVGDRALKNVHLLGFINQAEIPRIYAMSDVLVLPSRREHRGTVINEAMACGLPIIISDRVGVWGPGDIVRHGDNGFVFPVGAIDVLAGYLDRIVEDPVLRERMGQRSREIIADWDFNADVDGILAALRSLDLPRGAVASSAEAH